MKVCDKFFNGNRKVSFYLKRLAGSDDDKLNNLIKRYKDIYAFLGDWRSNSMVNSIENLLH